MTSQDEPDLYAQFFGEVEESRPTSLKVMEKLSHVLRIVGVLYLMNAILRGSLILVAISIGLLAFDALSRWRAQLADEHHKEWLAQHRANMNEMLERLTPEEREMFRHYHQQTMRELGISQDPPKRGFLDRWRR